MVDSGLTFKDIKWLITMLTAGVLSIFAMTGSLLVMKFFVEGMKRWDDFFFYPIALVLLSLSFALSAAVWWYTLGALLKLFGIDEKRRPLPRKK